MYINLLRKTLAICPAQLQNNYMKLIRKQFLTLIFVLSALVPVSGKDINAAFLSIENMNRNPGYDYLQGIIEGLFLFDLSSADNLVITDRSDIENVMYEQKLKLSGIVEDKDMSMTVGKMIGADFILSGSYVFLGDDLLINMKSINVITGNTTAFSVRGYTENTIHELSQQVIFALTGDVKELVSDGGKRSIISLRDESPGSIDLYSFIRDAEIFLDGEFAGYTKGNGRVAIILEDISPGMHTIRTHLDNSFGVIDLPEFIFRDWEEEFEVKPGKKVILRDKTRHFNSLISDHLYIVWEGLKIEKGENTPVQRIHDKSLTDRSGKVIPVILTILAEPKDAYYLFKIDFNYNGKIYNFEIVPDEGKDLVFEEDIEKTKLKIKINDRYEGRYELDYSVKRTDIRQNMFWDE